MVTNGKSQGQYIQQVIPATDPCPDCHEYALVISGKLELRGQFLQLNPNMPPQGRLVSAYMLCFNCLRRSVFVWDAQGKTTETVTSTSTPPQPPASENPGP